MRYLLDTNICVDFLRKRIIPEPLVEPFTTHECAISEMTLLELYYGAYCSSDPNETLKKVTAFCSSVSILPITPCLQTIAQEKARLRKAGMTIEDTDAIIAGSAKAYGLTLVTRDSKHMRRIDDIEILLI